MIPSKPIVDLDDNAEGMAVEWHFGPQGHPASMVATVYIHPENQMKPLLWVMGPITSEALEPDVNRSLDLRDLKSIISYGEKINREFGKNPYWHQCNRDRDDYHHLCEGCADAREIENNRANQWVQNNPYIKNYE